MLFKILLHALTWLPFSLTTRLIWGQRDLTIIANVLSYPLTQKTHIPSLLLALVSDTGRQFVSCEQPKTALSLLDQRVGRCPLAEICAVDHLVIFCVATPDKAVEINIHE